MQQKKIIRCAIYTRKSTEEGLDMDYNTLDVLGMLDRLQDIADGRHDLTGLMLEEERLPKRIRIPKHQ